MIRTILVTHCRNTETGETKLFYGRYDPVTLARNHWQAFDSTSVKYSMTDEEFARHAKIVNVKEN